MRRILTSSALAALAVAAGIEAAPASAQQGPVVYSPPQPATAYAAPARTGDPRAVLPAFSQRGGIGTTPFLGNTRGLGGFSTNYDAPPRARATTAQPARRRWVFFRRNR